MEKDQNLYEKARALSKKINWLAMPKVATSIAVSQNFTDLQEILKQEEVLSLITEFEDKFTILAKDFAKEKRLVVFVDDLDRCLPEKALEILESIKIFLDADNCVFILGLNKQILDNFIKVKYKDTLLESIDYLEKIINLSFNIPELQENDVRDFIAKKAPHKIRDYSTIMANIGGNPRRIKRIINKCVLQMILAEESPHLKVEKEVLAKLAVLELKWNKFYINLINSYNSKSNDSMLLKLENINEKTQVERLKIISDFHIEEGLLTFLCDHPTLWETKLDPYIFLRSAATSYDESPISYENKMNMDRNELLRHSIEKLKSQDLEKKVIGLAEIYHGWMDVDGIDNKEMLRELIESYNTESNTAIKEQILNIISRFR